MSDLLFIGSTTIHSWLANTDLAQPVFASLARDVGKPGPYRQRTDTLVILIAQKHDDLVYYCRIPVAQLEFIAEDPLTNDHPQRLAQAQQAFQRCLAWLEHASLTVQIGTVAMPPHYAYTDAPLTL